MSASRPTPRSAPAVPYAPGEAQLSLSEVLTALSHALDLTEGQPFGHTVRTCLIGMRLAEELVMPLAERSALYYALLLKDAGCSSNAARMTARSSTGTAASASPSRPSAARASAARCRPRCGSSWPSRARPTSRAT